MSSPDTPPPADDAADPAPPAGDVPPPAAAPQPAPASDGGLGGQVILALLLLGGVLGFAALQLRGGPAPTPGPSPAPTSAAQGGFQLGLQLHVVDDYLVVREALAQSNGALAGLLPGDRILSVQGRAIPPEGDSIARAAPIRVALSELRLGDTLRLLIQRRAEPGPAPTPGEPTPTPAPTPVDGFAPPFEVIVTFVTAEGQGFESGLAKGLIRKGVTQLLSVKRADGWWPHYVVPREGDPEQPNVAVSALVAYALRRASPELDDDGRQAFEALRDALVGAQAPDGGLRDPLHAPQHRVYATALAVLALHDAPGQPCPRHAAATAKMVAWLVGQQVQETHGYDAIDRRYGGWSYHDEFASAGLRTDVSTARYALQALAEAGLPADAPTWRRAGLFLDLTQNFALFSPAESPLRGEEQGLRDGGFSFRPRLSKAGVVEVGGALLIGRSYGTATADGLLGLLATAGADQRGQAPSALPEDPRQKAALLWLAREVRYDGVPGFGADPDGWSQGLLHYYYAALAETLDRAGVWKLRGAGQAQVWAEALIRELGFRHGRAGERFTSESALMHEDAPAIAPAFAVIALAAARDRLAAGGGLEVEALPLPQRPTLHAADPAPAPDAFGRGRELFQRRCLSCHGPNSVNGPDLSGVGAVYLEAHGAGAEGSLAGFLARPQEQPALLGWGRAHGGRQMLALPLSDAERADLASYLLTR